MLEIQRRVRPGHCFQGTEREKYIKCYWEYNGFIWRTEWKKRKKNTTCRMFWRFCPKMKPLTISHSPAPSRLRELCESHSVVSELLWPPGLYSPLNPGLPHCRRILYQLSCKGSPRELWREIIGWYHPPPDDWAQESDRPHSNYISIHHLVRCEFGNFFNLTEPRFLHPQSQVYGKVCNIVKCLSLQPGCPDWAGGP